MRPFEHIDSSDIREIAACRRRVPAHLLATRFYGDSNSSQANPLTLTTSGAASPIAAGGGSSATSGSIALGEGAKYQESGSLDLSGADIGNTAVNASSGATVNVGNTALDSAIGQVISSLSNGGSIPVSLAGGALGEGGGTTVVPVTSTQPTSSSSWLDNINWTLVAIVGAGFMAAVAVLFLIEEKR